MRQLAWRSFVLIISFTFISFAGASEKICGDRLSEQECKVLLMGKLSDADNQLNMAYQNKLAETSKKDRAGLRDAQRKWIKFRNSACKFNENGLTERNAWLAAAVADPEVAGCLIEQTLNRVRDLQPKSASQKHIKKMFVPAEMVPSVPQDNYTYLSKTSHRSGKYYFEMIVDHGAIRRSIEADIQFGVRGGGKHVALLYKIRPQDLVIQLGDNSSVTIVGGNLGEDIHLPKVVIGVAIDLDSRRFYSHRDGNWGGKPPGHKFGTTLPPGDEFYAEASSSVSIPPLMAENILSINFGERPFAYPLPIGYTAYDADDSSVGTTSNNGAALPDFSLVEPGTSIDGQPLSVWIQRYWQWMKSFPPGESPTDDTTGARCNAGQAGAVFFLAGTNQEDGQITRSCLVPKGKYIFIPVINVLMLKFSPQGTATCDYLVQQARNITENVVDLSVTINGKEITSLHSYRAESGCFELLDASIPSTCPAAAAGYWLVLKAMATGNHEIRYSGKVGGTRFTKRLNYHIRVE